MYSSLKTYLSRNWVTSTSAKLLAIDDGDVIYSTDALTCVAFGDLTVLADLQLESFLYHNLLPLSLNCRHKLPSPSHSSVSKRHSLEIEDGWNRDRGGEREREVQRQKRERDDALVVNTVGKNERQKLRSELAYECWHLHPSGRYPLLAFCCIFLPSYHFTDGWRRGRWDKALYPSLLYFHLCLYHGGTGAQRQNYMSVSVVDRQGSESPA